MERKRFSFLVSRFSLQKSRIWIDYCRPQRREAAEPETRNEKRPSRLPYRTQGISDHNIHPTQRGNREIVTLRQIAAAIIRRQQNVRPRRQCQERLVHVPPSP